MGKRASRIAQLIAEVGGRLEWTSAYGSGVSFAEMDDEAMPRIRDVLPYVVWLDVSNTEVGDVGLSAIVGASSLESIDIHNTRVSARGIEYLLINNGSVVDIAIHRGQLSSVERLQISRRWPAVHFDEK